MITWKPAMNSSSLCFLRLSWYCLCESLTPVISSNSFTLCRYTSSFFLYGVEEMVSQIYRFGQKTNFSTVIII